MDAEVKKKVLPDEHFKYIDSPFSVQWIFGRSARQPVLNLSLSKECQVCFSSGHISNIFCEKSNRLIPMVGHVADIIDLSADNANRFIATADKRYAINVWDMFVKLHEDRPVVIRSVDSPFGADGIGAIAMSADAKYLAAVSGASQKCTLKVWLWSRGKEEADFEIKLPSRFGAVKTIRFNRSFKLSHMMVITFSNGIAFAEWVSSAEKLRVHIPDRSFMNVINDSIYLENSRKVVSVTNTGHVIIWSDAVTDDDDASTISIAKEFTKSLKLDQVALTAVQNFDHCICIGDEAGRLKFYDYNLTLLYWNRYLDLPSPVLCISPNPMHRIYELLMSVNDVPASTAPNVEILYEPMVPHDFSVAELPFVIRDFIITTGDGKLMAVNFIDGVHREIYYQSEQVIVAMDLHPTKDIVCMATKGGRIVQYDVEKRTVNLEMMLALPQKQTELNDLVFSGGAVHFVATTTTGEMYELDAEILTPYRDNPFKFSDDALVQIKFNDDAKFLALADANHRVMLLYFCSKRWLLIGKNLIHRKPVCSFVFMQTLLDTPRLLSVGQDMLLVEYDVEHSITTGQLEILRSVRYDQSSIPVSVSLLPTDLFPLLNLTAYEDVLLVTDNQLKIKLLDVNSGTILFTFLGPLFGDCLTEFKNLVNYGLFALGNKIGLYLLPFDGNPFRAIGVTGSGNQIKSLKISRDGNVFCLGAMDYAVTMWNIHEEVIMDHYTAGGDGLRPFCSVLPGGHSGWLFQELLDMFYYLQILASGLEGSREEIKISDYIPVTDIVDFMRGVNFFPTDFEIRNIMKEMEVLGCKERISFEELVKLYINHRQLKGTRTEMLEAAIQGFLKEFSGEQRTSLTLPSPDKIKRGELVKILTEYGEKVDRKQAIMCLKELWTEDAGKELDEKKLPHQVNISEFIDNLLGLGMSGNDK